MNTADRQDISLSVILLILLAVIIFSGVFMWMPHHNSGWMGSEYSQGMMHNWPGNR